MNKSWFYFLGAVIFFMACGDSTKKEVAKAKDGAVIISDDDVKVTYEKKDSEPTNADLLKSNRSHALALIDSRAKKDDNKAFSMIVVDYWVKQFVFDGDRMSEQDEYLGHWIKYNDDFTYNYGVFDQETGGGKYHYLHADQKMIMIDSDRSKMPEEWKILSKEDIMVLVGSNYFGNNPSQIKMHREPSRPAKS